MIKWFKSLFSNEMTINIVISGDINVKSEHANGPSFYLPKTEIENIKSANQSVDTSDNKSTEVLPDPSKFRTLKRPVTNFGTEAQS